MSCESRKVFLYVYDLSNGLAASLSTSLLGKQIDGIWHTSIVVDRTEFYFGGGISSAPAGTTAFGKPVQIRELGETYLPTDVIRDLIEDLRHRFSECSYNLLSNNCNNFTDELSKLLLGKGIPVYLPSAQTCEKTLSGMQDFIVKLPDEVMSTPFGQMIRPMLAGLENQLGSVNEAASQPQPPKAPQPPARPAPQASTSTPPAQRTLQAEVEDAIRREFAALVAEGSVTPNQAAVMALEKVREMYGNKGSDTHDKSQA